MGESTQSTTPPLTGGGSRSSPIFVGGQRRSGTTLMWASLNRHPNIVGLPECHFFQHLSFRNYFKELRQGNRALFEQLGVHKQEMDEAVGVFIDTLFATRRMQTGSERWLEKSPENIRRIDYLFRLFPRAQFIHMIRDPRDTLASMKHQAVTEKPYWDKFVAEVTAPEWVRCIDSGERWRPDADRYMEVLYEQLVADPEPTLQRVLKFLHEPWNTGLTMPSLEADGGKPGNEHQPVFRTSVGRWVKDLTVNEIASIEAVAGEKMTQFGYHLRTR